MATRSPASSSILAVGLELLAVGVFTLIAGANDDVGSIVLLFMAGLWIAYLITESAVVAGLEKALGAVMNNGSPSSAAPGSSSGGGIQSV